MADKFNVTFSGVQVITSPNDHYLEDDWQTLVRAPLWVFEAVAAADKAIDAKERAAFHGMLDMPPSGVFTIFVFAHVRRHEAAVAAARAADPRTPLAGLADVETLLRNYPKPQEADEFRRGLIALAQAVAEASGGGVLGRGSKISDAEAEVIAQIRATLRLPQSA